jgi:hypothetical protein
VRLVFCFVAFVAAVAVACCWGLLFGSIGWDRSIVVDSSLTRSFPPPIPPDSHHWHIAPTHFACNQVPEHRCVPDHPLHVRLDGAHRVL